MSDIVPREKTPPRASDGCLALDRALPSAVEVEKALLGAVIEVPKILYRIPNTTEEHFFSDKHRAVWRTIALMAEEQEPISLVTVKDALRKRGMLEQAGGSAYVSSLIDETVPDIAGIEHYAETLAREAKLRAIIVASNTAMRAALTDAEEPEEVIAALFQSVGQQATEPEKQASHICEVVAETSEQMQGMAARNESISLVSGWDTLDDHKVFIPTFAVTGSHTKFGKSAWMVNMADALARRGQPTAMISLESSKRELTLRHMSLSTGIKHSKMRDWRYFSEGDHRAIAEYRQEIAKVPMFIVRGLRTAEEITLELRRLKHVHGLKAAFIDYIQNVELKRRVDNREERLHEISKMFLDTANDLEIHINALSQLREGAGKDGARLTVEDLAYAKSIAKSARIVLMFSRPFKADAAINTGGPGHTDYRDPQHVDFQIEANNEGRANDFIAQFDETTQRFWEDRCQRACMHEKCRNQVVQPKQERLGL